MTCTAVSHAAPPHWLRRSEPLRRPPAAGQSSLACTARWVGCACAHARVCVGEGDEGVSRQQRQSLQIAQTRFARGGKFAERASPASPPYKGIRRHAHALDAERRRRRIRQAHRHGVPVRCLEHATRAPSAQCGLQRHHSVANLHAADLLVLNWSEFEWNGCGWASHPQALRCHAHPSHQPAVTSSTHSPKP